MTTSGPPPTPPAEAAKPVSSPRPQFRVLRAERIVTTAEQLERRIAERFPQSGLRAVADDLCRVAKEAVARSASFRRPNYWLRLVVWLLIASLMAVLISLGVVIVEKVGERAAQNQAQPEGLERFEEHVQTLEAALGCTVFLGAAVIYLLSLERRWKRERLLAAMRELRALAHIVDMHQLTKDPETTTRGQPTASSPQRTLTTFELSRYLDYCSELLSLINKIGAIYVQEFPDPDALEAADQLANLTNGLSRNIWQKIMILDRAVEPGRGADPV
jgi:hypothetical protein